MADDLKRTGKADDARINTSQNHEVHYWAQRLGVTPEKIHAAVKRVGSMVKDVKRALRK